MKIPKLKSGEGKTLVACVAILGLAAIVAAYFWGQNSRYILVKGKDPYGNEQVIKLDRQSGKSWLVTSYGEKPLWNDAKERRNSEQSSDTTAQAVDISRSRIEILGPELNFSFPEYGEPKATLTGRIRNRSDAALNSFDLRVRLFKRLESSSDATSSNGSEDRGKTLVFIPDKAHISDVDRSKYSQEPVDGEDLHWPGQYEYRSIPPGETESFEMVSEPTTMRPPDTWTWSSEITEAHGS